MKGAGFFSSSWWRSLTGREEVTKEERKLAKAVNFGLLYGMGPKGLRHYARASYGVDMTQKEADHYWQSFFENYPGLKSWHDREYQELKKQGNTETLLKASSSTAV
jgi:DNA polymerase I-like protein with 3'-5' exonuclease and polymerase domains